VGVLSLDASNDREAQEFFAKARGLAAEEQEIAHRNLAVAEAHLRDSPGTAAGRGRLLSQGSH
jgi:hypothetical protein